MLMAVRWQYPLCFSEYFLVLTLEWRFMGSLAFMHDFVALLCTCARFVVLFCVSWEEQQHSAFSKVPVPLLQRVVCQAATFIPAKSKSKFLKTQKWLSSQFSFDQKTTLTSSLTFPAVNALTPPVQASLSTRLFKYTVISSIKGWYCFFFLKQKS